MTRHTIGLLLSYEVGGRSIRHWKNFTHLTTKGSSGEGDLMNGRILPHAKAMVLCESVERHPDQGTIDLLGVRTTIQAPAFPYRHRQLSVYLELTCHES